MDSNISTLLIGFSLLHTKKTNQTHNVKDLMVIEFFQIMFTKSSRLFVYSFTILKEYDL